MLALDSTRRFCGSARNRKRDHDVVNAVDVPKRRVSRNFIGQVVTTTSNWFEGFFRDTGGLLSLMPDVHVLRIGEWRWTGVVLPKRSVVVASVTCVRRVNRFCLVFEQGVLRCGCRGQGCRVQRSRLVVRRSHWPRGRYLQGLVPDVNLLCSGRRQWYSGEAQRPCDVQRPFLDDVQDHHYGSTQ
jgi:hypothetical protein